MDIIGQIKAKFEEITADLGYELVELSSVRLGGHTVVRAFLYKPGGVNIRDCKIVSRAYSDYLDLENPISGEYRLEVSSLGLDRPLKTPADFKRRIGEELKVELTPNSNSENVVTGELIDTDDIGIVLKIEDDRKHFAYENIVKAKIIY